MVKDYVTEWGAAVKELIARVRDCGRGRSQKTYNFDSLRWLFAEGSEGRNPMLGEYLDTR